MDEINREILEILQKDGRASYKEIGQIVNLSAPAVAGRISQMERDGTIRGYTVDIDPLKISKNVSAIIGVDINSIQYGKFIKFCEEHPAVMTYYRVIGAYNAILHVHTKDSVELEKLIDEIKRFGSSYTSIILSSPFYNKVYY